MEYNDWYERYQKYQAQQNPQPKKKKGVSIAALVAAVLVAALVAGVAGGFVTSAYLGKTQASALPEQQQAALPENSDPQPEKKPSVLTEAPASSQGSSLLQNGTGAGYTKAQIVEIAAPSVVGIDVTIPNTNSGYNFGWGFNFGDGSAQETTGAGSGVIITSDGYIVTCNHVVDGASSIKVTLNDDTQYDATLVGTDERNDLAIIKIEASGLTPATLGDSDMLTVGEDVIAIGNHLGELRGTATGGMISALNREVNVQGTEMALLQHDAAVSPGSSGGGLFNSSGSLIGIVNAKASSSNAEGLGFAIPVNSVK